MNVCHGLTGPADYVNYQITRAAAGKSVLHGNCKNNGHCYYDSEDGITVTECLNYE